MKKLVRFSSILLLLWLISACSMFKPITKEQYNKDGLSFTHLSSWAITSDETTIEGGGKVRIVHVEGPDDTILILSRFPASVGLSLEEYAEALDGGMKDAAKEMTGGYEVIEMSASKLSSVSGQLAGVTQQGILREFDVKLLSVPVPHRAELYLLSNEKERWFIMAQSPQEAWEKQKAGFQTMFDSLSVGESDGSVKEMPFGNVQ